MRSELQRLVEASERALEGYIGDDPRELPEAAEDLYFALRELVSCVEEWIDSGTEAP